MCIRSMSMANAIESSSTPTPTLLPIETEMSQSRASGGPAAGEDLNSLVQQAEASFNVRIPLPLCATPAACC